MHNQAIGDIISNSKFASILGLRERHIEENLDEFSDV
jgi:hypothetical protein